MNMANKKNISDELLAAYLDGNTTKAETLEVLGALNSDESLREAMEIALSIDEEFLLEETLPAMKNVAENSRKICSVLCEAYVLHRRKIQYEEKELLKMAKERHWINPNGTPLHLIGQLLSNYGLMVDRKYNANLETINKALSFDNDVIVAVDSDKLYPEREDLEDEPNHAVVVLGIKQDAVSIYDPSEQKVNILISKKEFLKAWRESKCYMVQVLQSADDYEPQPIDLEDIKLTDDLLDLQEALAENAHDVWAEGKKREGWSYGQVRDDVNKKDPDLVPYSALPDYEKEYNRLMALDTIKLVKKLGFNISKG